MTQLNPADYIFFRFLYLFLTLWNCSSYFILFFWYRKIGSSSQMVNYDNILSDVVGSRGQDQGGGDRSLAVGDRNSWIAEGAPDHEVSHTRYAHFTYDTPYELIIRKLDEVNTFCWYTTGLYISRGIIDTLSKLQ